MFILLQKHKHFIPLLIGLLSIISFGTAVHAANPFATPATPFPHGTVPPRGASPVTTIGGVLWVLNSIILLAQMIFWILTVAFGLYGAYLYLFSGGNKESATTARKVFQYSAIAAILAVISYGIPSIISNIFGY